MFEVLRKVFAVLYLFFALLFPFVLTDWLSISDWFVLPLILLFFVLTDPWEAYRRFRSLVLDVFDDLVLGRTRGMRRKCIRSEMRRGFRELFDLVKRYKSGEVGVNWLLVRLEQIEEVIGREKYD